MRTVKKGIGALSREDGRDWDIHLQAVAFGKTRRRIQTRTIVHSSSCTDGKQYFLYRDTWIRQGSMLHRGDGLAGCGARGCIFTKGIWPRLGVVKNCQTGP